MPALVYMIPAVLQEEALATIPLMTTDAVRQCQVFFTENERTARRYLKALWKHYLPGENIVIGDFEWFVIAPENEAAFRQRVKEGKTIGILSEAGCPGVADPGQSLAAIAQDMQAVVKPLTGPSSILLALMASGMSGQRFQFHGYLPIDAGQRQKALKDLETESARKDCTQIFIETPYRNNQLLETILKHCQPATRLCIAVNLTGPGERVVTKTVANWKKETPDFHKQPAIFLLYNSR